MKLLKNTNTNKDIPHAAFGAAPTQPLTIGINPPGLKNAQSNERQSAWMMANNGQRIINGPESIQVRANKIVIVNTVTEQKADEEIEKKTRKKAFLESLDGEFASNRDEQLSRVDMDISSMKSCLSSSNPNPSDSATDQVKFLTMRSETPPEVWESIRSSIASSDSSEKSNTKPPFDMLIGIIVIILFIVICCYLGPRIVFQPMKQTLSSVAHSISPW